MISTRIERVKGRLEAGVATEVDQSYIVSYVELLEELLDEGDDDDFFGTEGWRRRIEGEL